MNNQTKRICYIATSFILLFSILEHHYCHYHNHSNFRHHVVRVNVGVGPLFVSANTLTTATKIKQIKSIPSSTTTATSLSSRKFKGTRMTGAGSRSKKNKSIFLASNSNRGSTSSESSKSKIQTNEKPRSSEKGDDNEEQLRSRVLVVDETVPMKGRIYTKITKNGELLLLFPSTSTSSNESQDGDENLKMDGTTSTSGNIVSIRMNDNYHYNNNQFDGKNNNQSSSFQATFWNEDNYDDDDLHNHDSNNVQQQQNRKQRGKRRKNYKKSVDSVSFQQQHDHEIYRLLSSSSSSSSSSSTSSTISSSSSSSKSKYKTKKRHNYSNEWIPIEGIYGIYNLPSGPYLILITDSELIYKSPTIGSSRSSDSSSSSTSRNNNLPLMHLRRIKSMEFIPLPKQKQQQKQNHHHPFVSKEKEHRIRQKLIQEEQNQLQLLRQSFKEHDFYYSYPSLQSIHRHHQRHHLHRPSFINGTSEGSFNGISDSNNLVIQDVTHSIQRFLEHWTNQRQMKEKEYKLDEMESNQRLKRSIYLLVDHHNPTLQSLRDDGTSDMRNWSIVEDDTNDKLDSTLDSSLCHYAMDTCSQIGDLENTGVWDYILEQSQNNIIFQPFSYSQSNVDNNEKNNNENQLHSWWKPLLQQGRDDESKQKYHLTPDSRFFWNEECVNVLLHPLNHKNSFDRSDSTKYSSSTSPYHLLLEHTIPVTSAFIGVQKGIELLPQSNVGKSPSIKYDQLLISRRSKYRAGTRFTKRGADGIGDVANFAETEQVCILCQDDDNDENDDGRLEIYSHVQTRGSIPLRWSSPTDIKTYRPKVLIGTDPLAQARALRNHLVEQLSKYCLESSTTESKCKTKLEFINLIDKHSDQGRLGRTFSAVLDAVLALYETDQHSQGDNNTHHLSKETVSHTWFDFHAECRKGRWHRLKILLDSVKETLDAQGYFHAIVDNTSKQNGSVIRKLQDGVVRTNCMDCLDRTNVVQSMFGRYILYKQFSERVNPKRTRTLPLEYVIGFKKDMLKLPWKNGEASHRLLWADNADAISRLYAGTPALKGDFTRTGKRTKRGALDDGLNSVTRFYLNNFIDADRQKGMDLLTGFTKFDRSFEDEDDDAMSMREKSMRITQEMEGSFSNTPQLNLGWLPGDLESHVRSATMILNESVKQQPSELSIQEALIDICRRTTVDEPWWVDESENLLLLETSSKSSMHPINEEKGGSANNGHLFGSMIALQKAPLATIVAILCFFLPSHL